MGKPSIRNVSKKVKSKKQPAVPAPDPDGLRRLEPKPDELTKAVSLIAIELGEIKGTLKQLGFLLASREAPKQEKPEPAPEAKPEKPKKELTLVTPAPTCPVPKDGKACGAEVEKVGPDLFRCKSGHTFKPAEYAGEKKVEQKAEEKPKAATLDELREVAISYVKSFSSQELGKQELGKLLLTAAPEPKLTAVPDEKRSQLIVRILSELKKKQGA